MAAITGSLVYKPQLGLVGSTEVVRAKFTFAAALATTDTYDITGLFPYPVQIKGVKLFGDVMDTNATKTLAVSVGNSDDADGFLEDIVLGQTVQTSISGTGALIGTIIDNKDIAMVVSANPATAATSGTFILEFVVQRVNYDNT